MKKESWDSALFSLRVERESIERLMGYIPPDQFGQAVDLLKSCGKVITCASGSSGIAAKKFAHSLCCINRPALFMVPSEAVHGGLGCVCARDVVVMVSRGGKTVELLPIIRAVRERGAFLIGVTENAESPLAQASSVVLPLKIERESDPCDVMATASFVATIALFDALLAALMTETGYTIGQFAQIHPGGAVGERLKEFEGQTV